MDQKLITILGPTAVGKTKLAAKLAFKYKGEIISADSRQVYKGMDIGTGKDYADYIINQNQIKHHLIDIKDPTEEFNLYDFVQEFNSAYAKIISGNKIPFLVGGTGLYLSAILQGYNLTKANLSGYRFNELAENNIDQLRKMLLNLNPNLHNTTDLNFNDRIIKAIIVAEANKNEVKKENKIDSIVIGIKKDREDIKKQITSRLKQRLENGMIEEVKKLLASGVSKDKLEFFGLEYKFIGRYVYGELSYNDMYQKLNSAIHQFAKRQMTWFRKMEREGVIINWINGGDAAAAEEIIDKKYFKD